MAHQLSERESGSVDAVIMRGGLVRVKLMHKRSHEARARRSHAALNVVMQNVAGLSHAPECVGVAAFNLSARVSTRKPFIDCCEIASSSQHPHE